MTNIAWLFPGQGSQAVGMGKDLIEASPAAKAIFDRADAALGEPLSQLILNGPAEELMLTANAQPALVTMSIAVLAAIKEKHPDFGPPRFAAGHSLGEYSALVAAGALAFEDAVRLVRVRGKAMQDAVPPGAGSMAAIMGAEPALVEAVCSEVAAELGECVSCANYNSPGQIVIAGTVNAVAKASEVARERAIAAGGRASAVPLKVSAPFHCALMEPVGKVIDAELAKIAIKPLAFPVIANVDAKPNTDPARVRELLVRQIDGAVRWEQAIRVMSLEGITHAIEIGPGKVLSGLVKRIDKEIKLANIDGVATLDKLGAFLAPQATQPTPAS